MFLLLCIFSFLFSLSLSLSDPSPSLSLHRQPPLGTHLWLTGAEGGNILNSLLIKLGQLGMLAAATMMILVWGGESAVE